MKILMINVVCGIRSTGRICTDLASELEKYGHEVKIAYGREHVPEQYAKYAIRIGTDKDVKLHVVKSRVFDASGLASTHATKKFIEWVKKYDPDVIHLHNVHGYYIDIRVLFEYLRMCGKKIIWTLHDCWSFTGHCAYFDYVNCEKWKTGCCDCGQKTEYPARIGPDRSSRNYSIKKHLFTKIPNLTLVTPSEWLANLLKESILREYPVVVIPNGIDTTIFKPVHSTIKQRYGCEDKKIVLGVAAVWDKRKGMDAFFELANRLTPEYQVILVGLSTEQIDNLPDNIIGIERTNSANELAELYSAADVFVNPTLEDNYPTTNLEAISCGTPVVTYETGGSTESALMYGAVVPKNDIDKLELAVRNSDGYSSENVCVDYRVALARYIDEYSR